MSLAGSLFQMRSSSFNASISKGHHPGLMVSHWLQHRMCKRPNCPAELYVIPEAKKKKTHSIHAIKNKWREVLLEHAYPLAAASKGRHKTLQQLGQHALKCNIKLEEPTPQKL